MKGLYIAKIDEEYSLDFGVSKKIKGQIQAFENLGVKIDYLRLKDKNVMLNDKKIKRIKVKYFAYAEYRKFTKNLGNEYDFIYARYVKGDLNFYKTLKDYHKKGVKVIVEIPTYPYDTEQKSCNIKVIKSNIFDKIIRKKLKKYLFRIAVTNEHKEIFGIKTININNGINIKEFPLIKPVCSKSINLVGIANLAPWHGYDRVIKGLGQYYANKNKSENVEFYIIGEGKEKENLMSLCEKLNLEDKVHFLGAKRGRELDEIFDRMHIGASSLALFRAGGGHDPIKSKEFLARGIPVLLGYKDRLIDMNLPYVFHVVENDEPIDIDLIVEKYNASLKINPQDIREYAKEFLSWEAQMQKILSELR